jgi:hypothetical protein
MVLLVFLHPVINASAAKEISATGAFFGVDDNLGADWTVEHLTREIREAVFIVTVGRHFVEYWVEVQINYSVYRTICQVISTIIAGFNWLRIHS